MRWFLVFLIFMNSAFACPMEPHELMMIEWRSFGGGGTPVNQSGITEEQFRSAVARVHDHFNKEFEGMGLGVNMNVDWNHDWFNAQTAWVDDKTIRFFYSGELARGKYMTTDALMLIACHEVGHHFGGLPKKGRKWSTSEGGADYYAALKCMKEILAGDPENVKALELDLPEAAKAKCREVKGEGDEYHLCLRITKAGEDMAKAFEYRPSRKEQTETMLFRPLPEVETTFDSGYPARACRAETVFQGALCHRGPEIAVSFENEHDGYCHEKNGDTVGMRPKCWYRPKLD